MDRTPLESEEGFLVNRRANRRYPLSAGMPSLVDEGDLGPQNIRLNDMYRWMSRGYDTADLVGNLLSFGSLSRNRRYLAGELALQPGMSCLYTSIGTGADLPFLAERVALERLDFVGLDLSSEMLQRCQRKLRRWPGPMLVRANAERLPFADATFDGVFHLGGINLFDRPAAAVAEMVRVAKPGAPVFIADETPEVVREFYQKKNPFTRKACAGIDTNFDPRDWIPADAVERRYEEIFKGRSYLIRFRTPARKT